MCNVRYETLFCKSFLFVFLSHAATVDFDRDNFTVGKNSKIPAETKRELKLPTSAHIITYKNFAVATKSADDVFPLRLLDLEKKKVIREMIKCCFTWFFSERHITGPNPIVDHKLVHPKFPPLANDKFLGAALLLNYGVFAVKANSYERAGVVDVVFILFRMDMLDTEQSPYLAGPEYLLRIHPEVPLNLDAQNCSVQIHGNILMFSCLLKDPDMRNYGHKGPAPPGSAVRRIYCGDLNEKLHNPLAIPIDTVAWLPPKDGFIGPGVPVCRIKLQKERLSKKEFSHDVVRPTICIAPALGSVSLR